MIKTLLTLLIVASISLTAKAQNESDTLVYFLNKNNVIVESKDSAEYILMVYPRDVTQKKKLYPFRQFYINGQIKTAGFSKEHSPFISIEGPLVNFFANGRRQSSLTYKDGLPTGKFIQNYASGKLYSVIEYESDKVKYIECRDTVGKPITENGNGTWIELNETSTIPIRYTFVKNGNLGSKWFPIVDTNKYAYYDSTGPVSKTATVSPSPQRNRTISLDDFLARNLYYPEEDKKNAIEGIVIIKMIVEKDGYLTHLKIEKAPSTSLADEALRLIELSSPWIPGSATTNKVPDRIEMEVGIGFNLHTSIDREKISNPYAYVSYISPTEIKSTSHFADSLVKVDRQPEFPGGLVKFGRFLVENIKFPAFDRNHSISGKVLVEYYVEEDGTLSNIRAISGPSETMKNEAVRVMRLSPKWEPALFNNKPVRIKYTVPISFTVE